MNPWAKSPVDTWRAAVRGWMRWLVVLGCCLVVANLAHAQATGPGAPLRLRVVGGLAGVSQYTRHEAPFWTSELARLSGGALIADIVPFDQAGIRGQDMLRLLQIGTVPFGTALLSRSQVADPELAAVDLPGMNPDVGSLRTHLAAYRPHLARLLRERHQVELLAVYTYPAQMLFCAKPIGRLDDIAGMRVRVGSLAQGDLIRALGAVPVATEFAEIVSHVRSGNVDCAITGSMSGNTIGLHEVTTHLYPKAISWGLSIFAAHRPAWDALPASARELLLRELPKLEQAIWAESERETAEGISCNAGGADCRIGRKGRMQVVSAPASDAQRLRQLLGQAVLPAWVRRCGASCAAAWNSRLATPVGVSAVAPP